jgi:ABC-type Fe3+/spermidine/putrescine transport system ATPase subunit
MEYYIEFRNITKRFESVTVLDNINLGIPRGCFMTLLGPSGCGKTTLMRLLAGFSEPEEGEIFLNKRKMNGLPPYKRGTPLVFQEYALFPHMTVYENISYGLRLKKIKPDEIAESVEKMLVTFNLTGMDKRFPRQLSGGQQQRVAFARALILGQEALLLDEPLSNLDAKLRVEVRSELRQIQKSLGITVIYVTHDQDEALSMSDKIAVMKQGRIVQTGSPWEIYFRPSNTFVAGFVGAVNLLPVQIEDISNDTMTVSWEGRVFSTPKAGAFSRGEKAQLALRPESVLIKPPAAGTAGSNTLAGKVTMSSFLGRYIRYWVKLEGRITDTTLIVDDANPAGGPSGAGHPIEENVELSFDTQKLHVINAE